jgi:hypothetical protein
MLGVVSEHGVQPVEAYHIGPMRRSQLHQATQVAEITNSPVSRRAQQIELRCNPPESPPRGQHRR